MLMTLLSTLLLNADAVLFRSDKIWAVLVVVLIIWAGILYMLLRTERKLGALEREMRQRKQNPGA